ncbi:MAG: (d)CMP kinase [Rhodospirillales bacterium]|nr:(d)CMP kinase [Rhodospirillales bacterium]
MNKAKSPVIIAIDGPAVSGKGTLAKALADALGFACLDTGATYRVAARMVLESGGDPADERAAVVAAQEAAGAMEIDWLHDPAIRTEAVSRATSKISVFPGVRDALTAWQRRFAADPPGGAPGVVLDGRDIGTVVCPRADFKFYVTASPEIRARRLIQKLQLPADEVTYDAVLADLRERDARDSTRESAPLRAAEDAILVDTSGLSADGVLGVVLAHIRQRRPDLCR